MSAVRWEHQYLPHSVGSIEEADAIIAAGKEGWELIGFDPQGYAWMKRPASDDARSGRGGRKAKTTTR